MEDNTIDEKTEYKAIDTLKYAVDKLKSKNIIPFNISLHGGEVTVLSKEEFRDLIKYVSEYYDKNKKTHNQLNNKVIESNEDLDNNIKK